VILADPDGELHAAADDATRMRLPMRLPAGPGERAHSNWCP
jgi:hypothetical protein